MSEPYVGDESPQNFFQEGFDRIKGPCLDVLGEDAEKALKMAYLMGASGTLEGVRAAAQDLFQQHSACAKPLMDELQKKFGGNDAKGQ